jgi:hypothetical protein
MAVVFATWDYPGKNCGNYNNTEDYYKVVRNSEFEAHKYFGSNWSVKQSV